MSVDFHVTDDHFPSPWVTNAALQQVQFKHAFSEANCTRVYVRDIEGRGSVTVDTGFRIVLDFVYVCVVLVIESRALNMLGKCCTTE